MQIRTDTVWRVDKCATNPLPPLLNDMPMVQTMSARLCRVAGRLEPGSIEGGRLAEASTGLEYVPTLTHETTPM